MKRLVLFLGIVTIALAMVAPSAAEPVPPGPICPDPCTEYYCNPQGICYCRPYPQPERCTLKATTAAAKPKVCPYGLPGSGPDEVVELWGDWWHEDYCQVEDQWWCDLVDADHGPEKCSNGDGTIAMDCFEWSDNSPRGDSLQCSRDYWNGMWLTSCQVSATVYCPGLGDPLPPPAVQNHWITFTTYADMGRTDLGAGACASGILRVDETGHPDKGVRCVGSFPGNILKTAECGCHVNSGTSSIFFGKKTKIGGNAYACDY